MSQLVRYVLPGALLAAVGSQIPLWFCIACPVVLGLLAPFIFNAGTCILSQGALNNGLVRLDTRYEREILSMRRESR